MWINESNVCVDNLKKACLGITLDSEREFLKVFVQMLINKTDTNTKPGSMLYVQIHVGAIVAYQVVGWCLSYN